jgi:hypothetical protein
MGEQNVTLEDLQKLESIADEAAESGDPAVMRTLLKRSLSLNFSEDCKYLRESQTPLWVPAYFTLFLQSSKVIQKLRGI